MTMLLLIVLWFARRVAVRIQVGTDASATFRVTLLKSRCANAVLGLSIAVAGSVNASAAGGSRKMASTATVPSARIANAQSEQQSVSPARPKLREGTLIPPTVGRVVMMGRRWAFIRVSGQKPADEDFVTKPLPARVGELKPRPKRLGMANLSSSKDYRFYAAGVRDSSEPSDGESPADDKAAEFPSRHILLAENLMLQRIVEAIRVDASDNVWSVTGEMTEFFRDNRLLLRTAQRAELK